MSNHYIIQDYLDQKENERGVCKTCGHSVPWRRDRLVSHKSSGNCKNADMNEVELFRRVRDAQKRNADSGRRERVLVSANDRRVAPADPSYMYDMVVGHVAQPLHGQGVCYFWGNTPRSVSPAHMPHLHPIPMPLPPPLSHQQQKYLSTVSLPDHVRSPPPTPSEPLGVNTTKPVTPEEQTSALENKENIDKKSSETISEQEKEAALQDSLTTLAGISSSLRDSEDP